MLDLINIDPSTVEFGFFKAFYLLPLPILAWLILPSAVRRRAALRAPFFDDAVKATGLKPKRGSTVSPKAWYQTILLILVWCCIITALAKPQIVGEPEKEVKTARNFLLAIDLSSSMATRDWKTEDGRASRWEAVKAVMLDFVEKRKGDRMGLVFFGSQAYLQAPFTTDLEMIGNMMDEVDVGLAGAKTALGNSIGLGIELFESDSIDRKVMLLLTDGVDSGSELKPMQAARLAALDSITIHTIGVGTANSGAYDLDEKTLRKISETTGGTYFNAMDIEQLKEVYNTLNAMEPIEFKDTGFTPVTQLYYYPLIVGGVIMFGFYLLISFISLFRRSEE